jgi:hypothetical protein
MLSKFVTKLMVLVFLLFTVDLFAQQQPEPKKNFTLMGAGYSASASSKVFAVGGVAFELGANLLSYTSYNVTPMEENASGNQLFVAGVPLASTARTGLGYQIFQLGERVKLFGLADGGVVSDGNVVTGSYAYGGLIDITISEKFGVDFLLQADENNIRGREFNPVIAFRIGL